MCRKVLRILSVIKKYRKLQNISRVGVKLTKMTFRHEGAFKINFPRNIENKFSMKKEKNKLRLRFWDFIFHFENSFQKFRDYFIFSYFEICFQNFRYFSYFHIFRFSYVQICFKHFKIFSDFQNF